MVLNDLFAFGLNEVIRVILTHFFIDGAGEAYYRLRTCMTNIDTDEHCSLLIQNLGELKLVQVATCFAVHLPDNVGSFGETELVTITVGDNLRGDAILKHNFFEHLIVVLSL